MSVDRERPKGYRKAWNGGSPDAAMKAARERTEAAIASGCPRCPDCGGTGGDRDVMTICGTCRGAGFLVPKGGMPLPMPKVWP